MSVLLFLFSVVAFSCSLRVYDHIEAAILYAVVSVALAFISHLSEKNHRLCKLMDDQNRRSIYTPKVLNDISQEKPTLK